MMAARIERPLLARPAALVAVDSIATTTTGEQFVITLLGAFSVRQGHRDVTPPAGHPSTLVKVPVLRRHLTIDAAIDEAARLLDIGITADLLDEPAGILPLDELRVSSSLHQS